MLTRRPLVCVHFDIHHKNMIIKDVVSYFLDWELALWGDPVYDLAVHFHKMGYAAAERDYVLQLWQAALNPEYFAGWEQDLEIYLAHEQIAHSPEFVAGRKAAEERFARGEYGQPLDDVIAELDADDDPDSASA